MTAFGDYARYYNLLYADKPYEEECDFVLRVLTAHGTAPATLLDLGCGTGNHDFCLAKRGIRVTGVDMSETMLACAKERSMAEAGALSPLPEFFPGDVRGLALGRRFDAALSLFHVMSYQQRQEDALAMLQSAYVHLKDSGLFLFDFWHGPGVLGEPPEVRTRRLENEHVTMDRVSRPEHRADDKLVIVHFEIRLTEKKSGKVTLLREEHPMRYWFLPELRSLAGRVGFSVMAEGGWMREGAPLPSDWYAWMLLKR